MDVKALLGEHLCRLSKPDSGLTCYCICDCCEGQCPAEPHDVNPNLHSPILCAAIVWTDMELHHNANQAPRRPPRFTVQEVGGEDEIEGDATTTEAYDEPPAGETPHADSPPDPVETTSGTPSTLDTKAADQAEKGAPTGEQQPMESQVPATDGEPGAAPDDGAKAASASREPSTPASQAPQAPTVKAPTVGGIDNRPAQRKRG